MDNTDLALKLAAVNTKLDRLLEAVARLEARMDAVRSATQQLEARTGLDWKREAHGQWCRCGRDDRGNLLSPSPWCPIHGVKPGDTFGGQ